ncbi:MAG: cobalamin-binding protein [Gammaproteobacteria bacterium]
MKIVSLLPSATEIICLLDLQDQLVGVTHECDFPADVLALPNVTKTRIPKDATSRQIDQLVNEHLQENSALYSLNMEVLHQLQPDIIITQALCDVCAVAEQEVKAAACELPGNPRVINLEPMSLEDVYQTLLLVGKECDRTEHAKKTVIQLRARELKVQKNTEDKIPLKNRPSVGFLEWIDPPFNAGHWTPELIKSAGGTDAFGNLNQPSETMSWEKVKRADPDVLFIACCGFGLQRTLEDMQILENNDGWKDLKCVKNKRVYVCDGNAYFSRSGPRLIDSLEIIAHTLHPEIHRLPADLEPTLCYCK